MKNVLWLASWYPNKLHPLSGDFIERHARAASGCNKITVLFLIKDDTHRIPQKFFVEERKYNDNCMARVLYYKPFSRVPVIESMFSALRYCIFMAELVRQHIQDNGRPDLLHVHVCWKAGLLALYCKWKYKLRYVITEHWSVFAPNAQPSFDEQPFIVRHLIGKIYRTAIKCSAVSAQLSNELAKRFKISSPAIIPNVVDAGLFFPVNKKSDSLFRFIHISEFNYQKNPTQLFEAISLLKKNSDSHFEVLVFAPNELSVHALASKYQVQSIVKYRKYVPQEVLAMEMNHCDCLILYSRYETFGCVVIEAMASGIPVIVSDVPAMHEIVCPGAGIIVPLDDPPLLAEKMNWMMKNRSSFEPATLAAIAMERYSFDRIGKMFDELYETEA